MHKIWGTLMNSNLSCDKMIRYIYVGPIFDVSRVSPRSRENKPNKGIMSGSRGTGVVPAPRPPSWWHKLDDRWLCMKLSYTAIVYKLVIIIILDIRELLFNVLHDVILNLEITKKELIVLARISYLTNTMMSPKNDHLHLTSGEGIGIWSLYQSW